jgi:CheY-like chemotaxis protein
MKQQIFDRFTQGEAGQGAVGSGLGLNIVKEFVELHGGTVVVVDAPGGGAVFQVEIPVRAPTAPSCAKPARRALPPAMATRPAAGAALPAHRAGKPRVLVAEDNPDLRLFLYDVLIDEYNVSLEEDGESALAAALADPPDLIITDLMMPRFDGERFVRALRAAPDFPHVPVLVLSARVDDVLRENLLEALVQDYVTKPFSPRSCGPGCATWWR